MFRAEARNAKRAAGGPVDPAELVDHEIADGRVDHVAVVEHAPELAGHGLAPEAMGEQAELGTQEPHDRVKTALDPRDGRAQQTDRLDALRRHEPDLNRDPCRPSSCRRCACRRMPSPSISPSIDLREPAGVVGRPARACSRSRSPGDPARGRGSVGSVSRRSRRTTRGCPPRPCRSSTSGPVAHRQRRDPVTADRDVVDLQQRRAAAREPEQRPRRRRRSRDCRGR